MSRAAIGIAIAVTVAACDSITNSSTQPVAVDRGSSEAATSVLIGPPTSATSPTGGAPDAQPPSTAIAVTETMTISDASPGTTLDMRMPITDSATMNDVLLSWAAARRSAFSSSAESALQRAAAAAATTPPVASDPNAVPAGGTTVGATTAPPPPPPPAPSLLVAAEPAADGVVSSAVRLRIDEELGTGPTVSHIAWYELPNSQVVLGTALIAADQRDAAIQLLQSRVESAEVDHPDWTTQIWPAAVTGSVLADLQLGVDGSLTATVEPRLMATPGEARVVRLTPEESAPLLSAEARWLLGQETPRWASEPADCALDRCVALTYDDGPSPDTPRLLEVLARADVRATFFMIGLGVQKRPEVAAAVADGGHVIGNHTWSHQRLGELDLPGQQQEVFAAEYAISAATGITASLLRPPYGVYDDGTRGLGFGVALWSVDTKDWSHQDPFRTTERALVDTRPGSVVLMHDLYAPTVDAAAVIIAGLRSDGYRLVTMDDLFGAPAAGTLYYEQSRAEPYVPPPAPPATAAPAAVTTAAPVATSAPAAPPATSGARQPPPAATPPPANG